MKCAYCGDEQQLSGSFVVLEQKPKVQGEEQERIWNEISKKRETGLEIIKCETLDAESRQKWKVREASPS